MTHNIHRVFFLLCEVSFTKHKDLCFINRNLFTVNFISVFSKTACYILNEFRVFLDSKILKVDFTKEVNTCFAEVFFRTQNPK